MRLPTLKCTKLLTTSFSIPTMTSRKLLLLSLLFFLSHNHVAAKCSFTQKILQCNTVSKGAFAVAFAAAAAAPAYGCNTMSSSQWASVGCHNSNSDKATKICAPATWSAVLKLFATAMALTTKILVKSPYNMQQLFSTESGRELMRHELRHIHQQSGISATTFGYRYISAYCDAGCSYANNRYVLLDPRSLFRFCDESLEC